MVIYYKVLCVFSMTLFIATIFWNGAKAELVVVNDYQEFEEKVLNNHRPVLVGLTSEHCTACKMVMNELKRLIRDRPTIDLTMVDVLQNSELADEVTRRFSRRLIPNVLGFRGGALVGEAEDHGTKSLTKFLQKVEAHHNDLFDHF